MYAKKTNMPASRQKSKIYIGTSGWAYAHWKKGVFYPKTLKGREEFGYYCESFRTVEINYSFYHHPSKATFKKWYEQSPPGFLYTVKAHRLISHTKRLHKIRQPWNKLVRGVALLREKLGGVLIQCPPNFHKDLERLESFSKEIGKAPFRLAMEFRHPSWFHEEVEAFLRRKNWAWVISSMPDLPLHRAVTAKFIYIRLHGAKSLFSSSYSHRELKEWAHWIQAQKGKTIFTYFNNDALGYAPKNARTLQKLLNKI